MRQRARATPCRMTSGRWLRALSLVALPAAAAADVEPVRLDDARSHTRQLSGFVQLGTAYRGIFPFDEEYCGEDDADKSYCLGRAPLALDLGAGYGVAGALDLLFTVSFGLESDFGAAPGDDGGPHTIALAPGIRLQLGAVGRGVA